MPRALIIATLCLFALVGSLGLIKKRKGSVTAIKAQEGTEMVAQVAQVAAKEADGEVESKDNPSALVLLNSDNQADKFSQHHVDKVGTLFARGAHKAPIVTTVKYVSKVPWIKGRPVWIADYATHYKTSRHFIARSLNQKIDYETQKVRRGDYFNVLSPDKDINFIMVLDISRAKMWFFYHDLDTGEKVCLKTMSVGLGRVDPMLDSGTLTPLGVFRLGDKVASYRPGAVGLFQGNEVELIQVFGTRWIPFEEEVSGLEISAKGYGLHGAPWKEIEDDSQVSYRECSDVLGKYESDGCVRLSQKDIEELYAIVITKPTYVEVVKDCRDATLFDFNTMTLD
ncbi:L,D-transpeptidase [Candidatus Aerophobetes bacterium]|uniref:L,D-transpeptidase n=1 Tax=Aerophobetes bacterium TaxID=2030807 RepID=A0A2A4X683_UNCAE|nr:MAG: L,D-transpeptidase [Candidatus Aerophobetes bacterium]